MGAMAAAVGVARIAGFGLAGAVGDGAALGIPIVLVGAIIGAGDAGDVTWGTSSVRIGILVETAAEEF
jgi:hypothetical protein